MTPCPWDEMTSLMKAALREAHQQLTDVLLVDPVAEDVRAVGISMFIEARKHGIELPVAIRFQNRVEKLRDDLADDETYINILAQHPTNLEDITDTSVMRSIILALEAKITQKKE